MMTNPVLDKRRLGRTDLYVTPLGMGGAWLGHSPDGLDEDTAVATVLRALELGIRSLDTSPAYLGRESERFIGLALEEWYRRGGKREDIVLSTKTGKYRRASDYSADGTKRSVEQSLALLKTDYLDIVLVHDPRDLTPVLAPGGARDALKALKAQGIIRAIGLGVRQHAFHQTCIETGDFDMSLTFRDYNLVDQSAIKGVLETASQHNTGVYNGSPLLNSLLAGEEPNEIVNRAKARGRRWPKHAEEHADRAQALWEWTQARNISLLALNLQYCLRETRIAATFVGPSKPEHIEADVTALSAPIPETVWQELKQDFGL